MKAIIDRLRNNKLTVLLLVTVGYLLARERVILPPGGVRMGGGVASLDMAQSDLSKTGGGEIAIRSDFIPPYPEPEAPPTTGVDRMVITKTTMSMVVKDVSEAIKTVQQKAESFGGYMVDSHLSKPEEAASGSITVRLPEEKLTEALTAFRRVGLRVVDENVSGRDVTDQYVDLEARLATLNKTKAKFEEILDRATQVQDLLNVQRELINLQSQTDSIKGQQQYLSQSAKLSKVTVYLSTDELALPYSPAQPWRPNVIFKLAVRSLVGTLRGAGTALIWIGVYAAIWIPILVIVWIVKKKLLQRS